MNTKKYGKWRGRPNEPPLNWNTPDRPVIRKVTGSPDDLPSRPEPDDDTGLVAVTLTNAHWLSMLKTPRIYGQAHGDANREKWRLQVRRAILGAVNPNTHDSQPVAVKLSLEDWREIWRQVRISCEEHGEEWIAWFSWLSHTMIKQIKGK